jgi:hypothetical protein
VLVPRTDLLVKVAGGDNNLWVEREPAALSRLALHADRPAEARGDPLGHGQSQTDARVSEAAGRLRAIEWLEDVRQVLGRDAAAVVFHGEGDDAELGLGPDQDRTPRTALPAADDRLDSARRASSSTTRTRLNVPLATHAPAPR